MKTEPTYSRALPEAMGYTVTMDDSAGYGVTRMIVAGGDRPLYKAVWNPRDDSAQCFEVLAWLDRVHRIAPIRGEFRVYHDDTGRGYFQPHTGTPASLRAAIVEAAERVADAKGVT